MYQVNHIATYTYIRTMIRLRILVYCDCLSKNQPSLIYTSDFAWLMICKIFLECYTKLKLSAMLRKVMSHLLMLQTVTYIASTPFSKKL